MLAELCKWHSTITRRWASRIIANGDGETCPRQSKASTDTGHAIENYNSIWSEGRRMTKGREPPSAVQKNLAKGKASWGKCARSCKRDYAGAISFTGYAMLKCYRFPSVGHVQPAYSHIVSMQRLPIRDRRNPSLLLVGYTLSFNPYLVFDRHQLSIRGLHGTLP